MKNFYKIGFINQVSGRLFIDLIEDLSKIYSPSILYTGNTQGEIRDELKENLFICELNDYNRESVCSRIFSGTKFIIKTFFHLIKGNHKLLFVVSNPPFVGLVILLINKLIGQKYIVLVYDIYPDILVNMKKLSSNNLIVKIWRLINKNFFQKAEAVITIGEAMKNYLVKHFKDKKHDPLEIFVIPNAADSKLVKPILKEKNSFSIKYGQEKKVTLMYSGNFGNSHSFEMILNAASNLRVNKKINFFLIGEGAQKKQINLKIKNEDLKNVISLPWQDESKYFKSIACADVALITMARGTEKLMVPSKIYYSMAVGSALLGIANKESELYRLIKKYDCGIIVDPGNFNEFQNAIIKFSNNKSFLDKCKNNSYKAYKKNFTKSNMVKHYNKIINSKLN